MSLMRRHPATTTSGRFAMNPFRRLQEQMNWLFDDRLGDWPSTLPSLPEPFQMSFEPRIETFEKGSKIEVSAELPGLDEKDIHLELSTDACTLILTGEKKYEKEEKDEQRNFYQAERSYGHFQRAVPLPSPVDPEKIKATYKNGVLKVKMHKNASSASRSIPLST